MQGLVWTFAWAWSEWIDNLRIGQLTSSINQAVSDNQFLLVQQEPYLGIQE